MMMHRGISPVMAEILMIAVAFMIGVAVFSWFSGLSKGNLKESKERYNKVVDCSMVDGEIVSFFLYPKKGTWKLMVSPTSTSDIYSVKSVEIVNEKGERCKTKKTLYVERGDIGVIEGNCSIISSCDDFYSLYVYSHCPSKGIYYAGKLIDVYGNNEVCKKPEERMFD